MKRLTVWLLFLIIAATLAPSTLVKAQLDIEDPFAGLFDEHGAVMMLIDPESGRILHVNEAATSFYGHSADHLLSMRISDINLLSDQEVEAEMQAATREDRNFFQFQHQLADESARYVEVYSYPAQFQERTVLFTIVIDAHDRHLLEQSLQQNRNLIYVSAVFIILLLSFLILMLLRSRKNLRRRNLEIETFNELRQTFIDADESLIHLKDESLRYLFVNKPLLDFYGLAKRDMLGKSDFEVTEEALAQLLQETDLQVLLKKERIIDNVIWKGRTYRTNKFPVRLVSGHFGVGAYIRDITEELKAQRKSQAEINRSEALVDITTQVFDSRYEMLDFVLEKAIHLTDSKIGYIYHYDETKRLFTLNSWSSEAMRECEIHERQRIYALDDTGFWGEAVRQRKPVILNEFQQDHPLKKGYPDGHATLHRFLSVPIMLEDRIVAVVGLANKAQPYDDIDIEQMQLFMGNVWNAVLRHDAQESLTLERNKYRQTLLSIEDGVAIVNREGQIDMINRRGQDLLGMTEENAVGRSYKDVFLLKQNDKDQTPIDPIAHVLETKESIESQEPLLLQSHDGMVRWIEDSAAPIADDSGILAGVVLVFRDVTERKHQLDQITHLSFHDPHTGLYNRRFFEEEMKRLDTERNQPLSILIGDVNGLKLTNDVFGHSHGDELLLQVARSFQSVCRQEDIISRWGGDEFTVLLPKTSLAAAHEIKKRVQQHFSQSQSGLLKGSISIGVACKSQPHTPLAEVLEEAEERMYQEKTTDRNQYRSQAVRSLLETLHEKSPREKAHAENVRSICDRLGQNLGLSPTEQEMLRQAAYFHDIGKVVLSEQYLGQRTVPYMKEDRDVRRHPTAGYRLLSASDELMDIARPILAHHEYWDGTGYPKGLKGKNIPLLARIIAVVESFEWLIHDLDDKDYSGYRKALDEIESYSGSRFDPEIVAALKSLYRN